MFLNQCVWSVCLSVCAWLAGYQNKSHEADFFKFLRIYESKHLLIL